MVEINYELGWLARSTNSHVYGVEVVTNTWGFHLGSIQWEL